MGAPSRGGMLQARPTGDQCLCSRQAFHVGFASMLVVIRACLLLLNVPCGLV